MQVHHGVASGCVAMQGCPGSDREDMPAAEALQLSLVPPHGVGCSVSPQCGHQPRLDTTRLEVVLRGKFSSGVTKAQHPRLSFFIRRISQTLRAARALAEQLLPPSSPPS